MQKGLPDPIGKPFLMQIFDRDQLQLLALVFIPIYSAGVAAVQYTAGKYLQESFSF